MGVSLLTTCPLSVTSIDFMLIEALTHSNDETLSKFQARFPNFYARIAKHLCACRHRILATGDISGTV